MKQWLAQRDLATDRRAIELQVANVKMRLDRLTDALIDQLIDKQTFEERKVSLEKERQQHEELLLHHAASGDEQALALKYLELAKSLVLSHGLANRMQKARLVRIAMSNCVLSGKKLYLQSSKWVCEVENTLHALCGAPDRDTTRTREQIAAMLEALDL